MKRKRNNNHDGVSVMEVEEEDSSNRNAISLPSLCKFVKSNLGGYPKSLISKDELSLKNNRQYVLLDFESLINKPINLRPIFFSTAKDQALNFMLEYTKNGMKLDPMLENGKKGFELPEIYQDKVTSIDPFGVIETTLYIKVRQKYTKGIVDTLKYMSSLSYYTTMLEGALQQTCEGHQINPQVSVVDFKHPENLWICEREEELYITNNSSSGVLSAKGLTTSYDVKLGFTDNPENSYFFYQYVTTSEDNSMLETYYITRFRESTDIVDGSKSSPILKSWKENIDTSAVCILSKHCLVQNLRVKKI